jgi:transposase
LDDFVDKDNPVRIIDAFIDKLDLDLLGGLSPNYHTIADFRKNNPKALKNCFKLYTRFLQDSNALPRKPSIRPGNRVFSKI